MAARAVISFVLALVACVASLPTINDASAVTVTKDSVLAPTKVLQQWEAMEEDTAGKKTGVVPAPPLPMKQDGKIEAPPPTSEPAAKEPGAWEPAPKASLVDEGAKTELAVEDPASAWMEAGSPTQAATSDHAGSSTPEFVITPEVAAQKAEEKKNAPKDGLESGPSGGSGASVLDVTIVCPTVRRFKKDHSPAPRYLKPMVEKLYRDLSVTDRASDRVKFLILNSDKEPAKHTEAVELKDIKGVQVLEKPSYEQYLGEQFTVAAHNEQGLYTQEDGKHVGIDTMKWVSAENLDGAYLMEKAKEMSEWVLFVEDDIEPTSGALYKLTEAVNKLKDKEDMLFLDLYTPTVEWNRDPGMSNFENLGKYNFFCCTQAMLFKSSNAHLVIDHWRNHATEPVDDNLVSLMKWQKADHGKEWNVYAMRPNLFEHVGAYSSNADKSTGIVEHRSLEFYP